MIVRVTQNDVDSGQPALQWACPIARAATRALGFPVIANGYGIRPDFGSYSYAPLSRAAKQQMHRYDTQGLMQPFTFRLTPHPDWTDVEDPR